MTTSLSNPGTAVTKPAYLARIVLQTQPSNLQPVVSFFKTFLNATSSYENEFDSFLTYDSQHHRIAIMATPNGTLKVPTAAGLAHVAFTFNTLSDLALAYLQRKAHGIEPFGCINHGPTTSMYYRDPDGNQIETQVDNFDTAEEASQYMSSEACKINPVGADFEPEELVRRLEAGEDEREIKKPLDVGPRSLGSVL